MNIDKKTISGTLLKGKYLTLECKRVKSEISKSVWETYSAFCQHYRRNDTVREVKNLKLVDL